MPTLKKRPGDRRPKKSSQSDGHSITQRVTPVIPRQTFLPPPGRPRWESTGLGNLELLYLSWGIRWMGDHPIPMAQHEGWVYAVILRGTPTLVVCDGRMHLRRGDVFIFHPDCAYGWQDLTGVSCHMMTWLWRMPPAHSLLAPKKGGYLRLRVGDEVLSRLSFINRECQRDVARVGETAGLALRRAHLDLDLCLAEVLNHTEKVNSDYRMNLAINFLAQSPQLMKPVNRLCEYLQVSPATLRNLFQKHCGKSPLAVALEMRMEWARKRLMAGDVAVKEIASELGYSHANDFSRAYKRYFGKSFFRNEK